MKNRYENLYEWEELAKILEEHLPELVKGQAEVEKERPIKEFPLDIEENLKNTSFNKSSRDVDEVIDELTEKIYPYRMRTNHPRFFGFIPSHFSSYSALGEIINTIHNPYAAGYELSKGTVIIENETIKYLGSQLGYDKEKLGGQFTSGGSLANLTGMIVGRDEKLQSNEFHKGLVYTSDQTHSSVAKAVHLMGIPRENVRLISSDKDFKINLEELEKTIKEDKEKGYIPFMIVGSAGATNTGVIDPLLELGEISKKYDLWFHVDGAYGASVALSSHKDLLEGIEKSDSVSWDGHKWLFQTYGCAVVICKDKRKLVKTYSVNPEYLEDIESTEEDLNFWDTGIEMTKPARGIKLWFTLQVLGLETIRDAIDQGFVVADWIQEEVEKYDNFEIISPSQLGIVNFRYVNNSYSERELDSINKEISRRSIEKGYAGFLTTKLKNKVVLRFCCNNPMTKKEEIKKIIDDIQIIAKEIEEEKIKSR